MVRTIKNDMFGLRRVHLSLMVCVCLMLVACARREPPRMMPPRTGQRVLFVVPAKPPASVPSANPREELNRWLVEKAGGYTTLPAQGAWKSPSGEVVSEDNLLYIVSLYDGDMEEFEKELNTFIITEFGQQEAYIERW